MPVDSRDITPLHVGASNYIAAVCRRLDIGRIVNRMVSWDEAQCKRSPGTLVLALVISILVQRRPLYRVWECFERLDLPTLFDEDVELDDFNDDAFGRTLDKLHDSGRLRELIHAVSLRAVRELPLGVRSIHADTTSISLAGEYQPTASDQAYLDENPEAPLLRITHGYSKDHRPDLKQFIYGLVVSGEGLPLLGNVSDGNRSDKTWNAEVLDEIEHSFLDPKSILYVADSALITPHNLAKMAASEIAFVSRLPDTYGLSAALKERAWSERAWTDIGRLSLDEKGAIYRTQSFEAALEGRTYRFVVAHSSALDKRKSKTLERRLQQERSELEKAKKSLENRRFSCDADGQEALNLFVKQHSGGMHTLSGYIEREERIQRPPGRPKKDAVPDTITEFRIHVQIEDPSKSALQTAQAKASTFVLISSALDKETWSDADLMREYKGQIAVETRFRNLKADPCIVDSIYVKSSRRAEALAYVFLLALIVAATIEIKIRQELKGRREQFLVPGNRLTDRPTMTMIFDVLSGVLTMKIRTDSGLQRVLAGNTDRRVKQILELTGLDETIYTERPAPG